MKGYILPPRLLGKPTLHLPEWFELNGRLHHIADISVEPTEPGFDYQVKVLSIDSVSWPSNCDVAFTMLAPNRWTPPQFVKRSGVITDYFLGGSGIFVILYPNNYMDAVDMSDDRVTATQVSYDKGCFICWYAGPRGLMFAEVCSPPYRMGDLLNLRMDGTDPVDVPTKFKAAYHELVR